MRLSDLLRRAWVNLFTNKNRSILTIISTAIGSAAIITMISLTGSARDKVINKFIAGNDLLKIKVYVRNSADDSLKEIEDIRKISGVKSASVTGAVEYDGFLTLQNKKINPIIVAVDFNTLKTTAGLLKKGSIPTDINGAIASGDVFSNSFKPNMDCSIHIAGKEIPIKLSGILKTNEPYLVQNIYKGSNGEYPPIIYIPVEKAIRIVNEKLIIKSCEFQIDAKDIKDIDSIINELKRTSYQISSIYERTKDINKFFIIIQFILGILGSITLIVSAIGTSNTMNMSVLDRRKEIGIFKAIGTKLSTIRVLFIIEAIYIGVLGSLLGIGLSVIFTAVINHIFISSIPFYIFQLNKLSVISLSSVLIVFVLTVFIDIAASITAVNNAVNIDTLSVLREE